ncbi:hypothetical protein [Pelobacter seleniigenes]|uniref:hypothetical protein n=1 Tax=Pelobacter seleniigenes TaxID=407188 RepID=UPI00138E326D|nr:hypothetical protein [Pelobacter seleniigenes]
MSLFGAVLECSQSVGPGNENAGPAGSFSFCAIDLLADKKSLDNIGVAIIITRC